MRRDEQYRPRLELPLDLYHPAPDSDPDDEDESEPHRGVVILDLG